MSINLTGKIAALWHTLWKPSKRFSIGLIAISFFFVGIIFWGGFNWTLELTNTEAFCISCHEMKDNPYQQYKGTIHDSNRTGVRATCPDCHVPKPWPLKILRKIRASNELYHKIMGTIDTKEKFLAHKLELAQHVWKGMEESDSRECRNCHAVEHMDFEEQTGRAARKHKLVLSREEVKGKTCISCHKGIAHELPEDYEKE